ncbi:hypothetical protein [Chromohalobacter canadensis]|nr:hypothetical protein [Chromohalobacter canadensis]
MLTLIEFAKLDAPSAAAVGLVWCLLLGSLALPAADCDDFPCGA